MDHKKHKRRRDRVRIRIALSAKKRAFRLSVYRSLNHIYAQIISLNNGEVLASASTLDKRVKASLLGSTGNLSAAKKVGEFLAQDALKKDINEVIYDRSGYLYHGRVKALAEGAREAGLLF